MGHAQYTSRRCFPIHSGLTDPGLSGISSVPAILTNSAGVHAPPMAETVLGAALYFARGFDFTVRSQARGEWDQSAFDSKDSPVTELHVETVS